MLDRKEIDLTAGGMLITNGRKPYVDFCIPTAELKGQSGGCRVMSMMINDTVKVETEKLLNCSSTTLPGTSDNLVHDKDGNSRQKR